jgi:hypothetical protein
MPIELEISADQGSLTLGQYIRAIEDSSYDLTCQDDLIASAPLLKRLANNKLFLIERLFDDLRSQLKPQAEGVVTPEVLWLHKSTRYAVRAVIWKPITAAEEAIPGYQYDVCHDHNFDFLTVGYMGPGYDSRSYTYDRTAYDGRLGEVIDLAPKGTFSLTNGKVALYRAKEDVHVQLPPDRLSVSLNLIPRGPVQNEMQFQFDESSGTICRYLDFTGLEAAVRVADVIGSQECLQALARIGKAHPSERTRALALAAQIRIDADRAEEITFAVDASQTETVKYLVRMELAEHGSTMIGWPGAESRDDHRSFGDRVEADGANRTGPSRPSAGPTWGGPR